MSVETRFCQPTTFVSYAHLLRMSVGMEHCQFTKKLFTYTVFDQLIATATITLSKEIPAGTMQRRLQSKGDFYGLVLQQSAVF